MEQDLDLEERNSDSGMNTTSGEQVEAAAANEAEEVKNQAQAEQAENSAE